MQAVYMMQPLSLLSLPVPMSLHCHLRSAAVACWPGRARDPGTHFQRDIPVSRLSQQLGASMPVALASEQLCLRHGMQDMMNHDGMLSNPLPEAPGCFWRDA